MKPTDSTGNPYANPKAGYYTLGILTVVYSFNFIDRQLLAILQEAVKAELLLSDTQLGLLTGFAFTLLFLPFLTAFSGLCLGGFLFSLL